MSQKNIPGLSTWLLKRPLLFAAISFMAMTIASLLAAMAGASPTLTSVLTGIAFLGAAAWLVRTLPAGNINQREFISLNNAQTLITSVAFIASMLFILSNPQKLMLRLLWLESHWGPMFLGFVVVLALFYLYLCGVYIANLYAKYRRVRTLGVSMWKTLATAPFGFSMLWIPGYLMGDTHKSDTAPRGWYGRITEWIMARPTRTAATLAVLIILGGFTFGFNAIMLTIALGVIFAIWCAIIGTARMRTNIGGLYTTVAIIINVAMVIGIVGYVAISGHKTKTTPQSPAQIIQSTPDIME